MKPKPFLRRWERRVTKLLAALSIVLAQCQAEGNREQVHLLRVTLRRLRLYVRVGQPVLKPKVAAAFRAWGRTIAQLTSPVRDLDVAIEWLQGVGDTAEAIAACQRQREMLWRGRRAAIPDPPTSLSRLAEVREDGKRVERLAKRAEKLLADYEATVRETLPAFFSVAWEAQHEFRRNLRWWRYLREISLTRREAAQDELLRQLVAAQEATGDRQNLALAEAALRGLEPAARADGLLRQIGRAKTAQAAKIQESLAALAQFQKWPARSTQKPQMDADGRR